MDVAEWYRFFAEVEAKESSPTYRVLANGVADDEVVLGHLARLPAAKRQPNLLFATVQFLDGPTADWLEFRRFMLSRWDDIAALMATRSTQTNEAARCAAFLPVLASIRSPIALIEVGAAAGLCLFPDRYSYSYSHTLVGDSPVRIDVECTGAVPVPVEMPDICWRRGIDLNPLDVTDPVDVKWLRACIWPEHDDRRDRLERAVKIAADDPPTIIAGDLNSEIDAVLASAPTDAVIVVFHSAVLAYLAVEQRQAFAENMTSRHEVIWLSNESPGVIADLASPQQSLKPNAFLLGRNGTEARAHTDPHGTWLDWIAPI